MWIDDIAGTRGCFYLTYNNFKMFKAVGYNTVSGDDWTIDETLDDFRKFNRNFWVEFMCFVDSFEELEIIESMIKKKFNPKYIH